MVAKDDYKSGAELVRDGGDESTSSCGSSAGGGDVCNVTSMNGTFAFSGLKWAYGAGINHTLRFVTVPAGGAWTNIGGTDHILSSAYTVFRS